MSGPARRALTEWVASRAQKAFDTASRETAIRRVGSRQQRPQAFPDNRSPLEAQPVEKVQFKDWSLVTPPVKHFSKPRMESLQEKMDALAAYSACDVSDALLKLEKVEPGTRPTAGFLEGIIPRRRVPVSYVAVGPAFTVQFQPKDTSISRSSKPVAPLSNIEPGKQWSDMVEKGTIVVVQQPPEQRNAAVGGIHALRVATLGAKGLLVDGKIRDLPEIKALGDEFKVWARDISIVGAGAECKPWAVQVSVEVSGLEVNPMDIIMLSSQDSAAIRIPRKLLDPVLEHLERRRSAENEIKKAVEGGMSVGDAFEKFR